MRPFLAGLLHFFFPRTCSVCGSDVPASHDQSLCGLCWESLPRWPGLVCRVCGVPLPDGGAHCHVCRRRKRGFHLCRSAGLYEGSLKTCLLQLKYQGKDYLSRPLGRWLAKEGTFLEELRPVDAVMAVPLHFWRKHRRGYNQSELLADAFCRETGLLHLKSVLRRKKLTRSQTELGRGERFENVAGAFTIRHPERIRGKSVLLVDDICTTGATLEACARVLREAGARQVNALTVARQI